MGREMLVLRIKWLNLQRHRYIEYKFVTYTENTRRLRAAPSLKKRAGVIAHMNLCKLVFLYKLHGKRYLFQDL